MTRRRLTLVLLTLLVLFALGAGAWLAAGLAPSWYTPAKRGDVALGEQSERMEFRVQQAFQRIRPNQPRWVLRIPDDVINAWLATRLGPWLEGQHIDWPKGVGTPQIRCQPGHVEVGVQLDTLGGRIGRIELQPSITSDGVHLNMAGCGVGRLPIGIPSSWVLENLSETPLLETPVATIIDLIDNRTVHILGVRLTHGHIELDLETHPASIP